METDPHVGANGCFSSLSLHFCRSVSSCTNHTHTHTHTHTRTHAKTHSLRLGFRWQVSVLPDKKRFHVFLLKTHARVEMFSQWGEVKGQVMTHLLFYLQTSLFGRVVFPRDLGLVLRFSA